MDGRKSFFATPLRAFIFIICVAAVILVFIIGTVFATTLIVRSPAKGNEQIAANEQHDVVNHESLASGDESTSPGTVEAKPDVGVEEAKAIAVEHAGFSVSEVSFSKAKLEKEHRMMVYEIEFYKDGMEYEYKIDAGTGEIIKYESEWDD